MFVMVLQSAWARVSNWVVDRLLGAVARGSALTHDDDMCLLLRVELPRGSRTVIVPHDGAGLTGQPGTSF